MLPEALRGTKPRQARRISRHLLAQLVCLGTHTITGLITAGGRQFQDWSADYRMYSKGRIKTDGLFTAALNEVAAGEAGDISMVMDETHIRKSGKKTHGVRYARDPLGPAFRVNFMRAQRFVQISVVAQSAKGEAPRVIPVAWHHAPTPPKPRKKAGEEAWEKYYAKAKKTRVGRVGAQYLCRQREILDEEGMANRHLWISVDGGFTNKTFLSSIPHNTTVIGRIRRDAKLHHLPRNQSGAKGRKKSYGDQAPTPRQLEKDTSVPWTEVPVFIGGKERNVRIKTLGPLRWRPAGQEANLQLIVIAPTPYRLSKNSETNYRQPAYLISTNSDASPREIVRRYVSRWGIEVNFRDEKSLLGVGEAQVRSAASVQNTTALAVAAYSLLQCAALRTSRSSKTPGSLPPPKWQRQTSGPVTTMKLIQNLRAEILGQVANFSGFMLEQAKYTKPQKYLPNPYYAYNYASNYS